jgi:hypothetical protein
MPTAYAIQVLQDGPRRSHRKWLTVATAKRLTVAETILASVRRDRIKVATLSRIRPFVGPLSRAYDVAEG